MNLLTVLIEKSINRNPIKIRRAIFDTLMDESSYQQFGNNIFIMTGAKPNKTELQTAEKLSKTNEYYIIFPSDGQIKEIKALTNEPGDKRNDIYLIDRTTFKAIAVDIKTCSDPSPETIAAHLSGGVNQAPNLILDITGKISKLNLIKGLRGGWSKRLKFLYLNYHGSWYLIDKAKVFDKSWLTKKVR